MTATVKHSKPAQSMDSTVKHPEPEQSVLPLFIRDKDLNDNSVMPMDICRAITNVVGSSKLDEVQKTHNIWRIYLCSCVPVYLCTCVAGHTSSRVGMHTAGRCIPMPEMPSSYGL